MFSSCVGASLLRRGVCARACAPARARPHTQRKRTTVLSLPAAIRRPAAVGLFAFSAALVPVSAVAHAAMPSHAATSTRVAMPTHAVTSSRAATPSRAVTSTRATTLSTAASAHRRPAGRPSKKKPPTLDLYAKRALIAYEAMQDNFYVPGTDLYRGAPYSYLWPFSQALAATVSLSHIASERPKLVGDLHDLMSGLALYLGPAPSPGEPGSPSTGPAKPGEAVGESSGEPGAAGGSSGSSGAQDAGGATSAGSMSAGTTDASGTTSAGGTTSGTGASNGAGTTNGGANTSSGVRSYNGSVAPPIGPGGASYYDDNEWVGIELTRLYQLDHEPLALQQAEQIMAFVMNGWQTTGRDGQPLPCPGGVPFSDAPNNDSRNTVTDGPGAELAVELYKITREARYLQFAEMAYGWVRQCLMEPNYLYADHIDEDGTIQRTLWSYNQGSMMGAGVLLYQATGEGAYLYQARQTAKAALAYYPYTRLSNENPFFVAVYFRNLMYLDSVTHDPPGNLPAREFVYYAWLRHRLGDNLFAYGNPPTTELLWQAAIVQIYAMLATSPSTYF